MNKKVNKGMNDALKKIPGLMQKSIKRRQAITTTSLNCKKAFLGGHINKKLIIFYVKMK